MHRWFALALVALTGCPPPPRYAVVDVFDPEPVPDALVAADCGKFQGAAIRTDDTGRARLPITASDIAPERCVVTVAKPGYPTVQVDSVSMCTAANACPPTIVQFFAAYGVSLDRAEPREYARPPLGSVR